MIYEVILTGPHKSKSGIVRIWRAFIYSMAGFSAALKHEHAFRQELFLAILFVPVAILLPLSLGKKALLVATLLLVLVVELLNTAIEKLSDRLTTDHDPQIGRVKDMGSAAVGVALLMAGGFWLFALAERMGAI